MRRWEYKHGLLTSVQNSDDLEKELNLAGADGWELVDVRRKERPIMHRRGNAFKEAWDYDLLFKRELP
jgi:hypothetical protein